MAPNRKELYDRIFPLTRDPSDIPHPRSNIAPWYALGWILNGAEVWKRFDPERAVKGIDPLGTAIRCRFFDKKLDETVAANFCPEISRWYDGKWLLKLTLNGSKLSQFIEKQHEITELLMTPVLEMEPEMRKELRWIRLNRLKK